MIGEKLFLATKLASSYGNISLILEGDSLIAIMAIKNPSIIADWQKVPVIRDISAALSSLSVWEA
jgi:hypothetical protein